jgi:hypothetical protein
MMRGHLSVPAEHQRQGLYKLHVNLRVMNLNKRQGDLRSAMKMSTNKAVYSLPILELLQQSRKTVGLVVQREHNLVNHCQSRVTCFS